MPILTKRNKRTPAKPLKPIGTKPTTQSSTGSQKEEVKKPLTITRPKKRPMTPPVVKPKEEVKPHVQETPKQEEPKREERTSEEVTKPMPTSERQDTSTRPQSTNQGASEKRVSIETMRAMNHVDRYKLWKELNKHSDEFIPIRKELPKTLGMQLDEALNRGIVEKKPPKEVPKSGSMLYCPYCVDWQVFHMHGWSGYNKCTGCSISTRDYYVSLDNKMFGKV